MKKEELSQDKQKQFDSIVAKMMEEMNALPRPDGKNLDGGKNKARREIEARYLPKLKKLFD